MASAIDREASADSGRYGGEVDGFGAGFAKDHISAPSMRVFGWIA